MPGEENDHLIGGAHLPFKFVDDDLFDSPLCCFLIAEEIDLLAWKAEHEQDILHRHDVIHGTVERSESRRFFGVFIDPDENGPTVFME